MPFHRFSWSSLPQPLRRRDHLFLADDYEGDFSAFGAPSARLAFPGAPKEGERLAAGLSGDFPAVAAKSKKIALDHGALVPLYFLFGHEEGKKLPGIILANPIGLSLGDSFRLGRRLMDISGEETWGMVASGDLSHRVTRTLLRGTLRSGRYSTAWLRKP